MNFYRANCHTYEAQNFSEHASYAYEHPINFSELSSDKTEVIILAKLNHIW